MKDPLFRRALWSAYVVLYAPWQGRFPFRSEAAIERAQRKRVRTTIAHAYRHVPYYRETMDRLGLRPAEFRNAADLGKLPLIERQQLQRDPEYFVSRALPIDRYVKLRTGGSSGQPVTVYRHPFALFSAAVHRQRFSSLVRTHAGSGSVFVRC